MGQMEVNQGRMDKQMGQNLKQQGMYEMTHGNYAQGMRDMMIGQAKINQGQQ